MNKANDIIKGQLLSLIRLVNIKQIINESDLTITPTPEFNETVTIEVQGVKHNISINGEIDMFEHFYQVQIKTAFTSFNIGDLINGDMVELTIAEIMTLEDFYNMNQNR